MTLGRAGQRAAGEDTDADDADTGRHSMIEEPSIILCWVILRQCSGRGRVEHIVHYLSAVECARVNDLMQRPRVADCGKSKETPLALLAQPLERRHHVTEPLAHAQRLPAAGLGD